MSRVLIKDTHYKIDFTINRLIDIEDAIPMTIDELLFKSDITDDIQVLIVYYGIGEVVSLGELESWYKNLSQREQYIVNLIVNGALLESMGVGREETTDTQTTNEEPKEKTFRETMEDLCCYVVANIGVSITEFYNSTPNLIYKLCDAHYKKLESDFNLTTNAMINAWGLTHSKKFKPINPFKAENNSSTKVVDLDKKKEELDFLFNLGGE